MIFLGLKEMIYFIWTIEQIPSLVNQIQTLKNMAFTQFQGRRQFTDSELLDERQDQVSLSKDSPSLLPSLDLNFIQTPRAGTTVPCVQTKGSYPDIGRITRYSLIADNGP